MHYYNSYNHSVRGFVLGIEHVSTRYDHNRLCAAFVQTILVKQIISEPIGNLILKMTIQTGIQGLPLNPVQFTIRI